jgi:hypothetical protein
MNHLLAYISLLLALDSISVERIAQNKQDVIKLDNVCVKIRYGYEYSIVSNMDYLQVNIAYNNVRGHVYVGYNPQIIDENRKWQSRSLRATIKSPKIVPLEGSQSGQFLGVPAREDDKFFH